MPRIVMLLIAICLINCTKKEKTVAPETTVVKDSVKVKEVKITESSKIIDSWAEIVALEGELKKMSSKEIKSVKDLELLKSAIDKLKESVPEDYKTLAIETRIKVLETEFYMLEQELKDGYLKNVNERKAKLNSAYNVFVGQIEAFIIKQKDYETYK